MKWLVRMWPHSPMVVEADSLEEANEVFDGRLLMLGVERSEAVFEPIEEAA